MARLNRFLLVMVRTILISKDSHNCGNFDRQIQGSCCMCGIQSVRPAGLVTVRSWGVVGGKESLHGPVAVMARLCCPPSHQEGRIAGFIPENG